ncbi:hypothetical protein BC567DRAFT_219759 [Phyllosticta citribraziliensis]
MSAARLSSIQLPPGPKTMTPPRSKNDRLHLLPDSPAHQHAYPSPSITPLPAPEAWALILWYASFPSSAAPICSSLRAIFLSRPRARRLRLGW